MDRNSSRVLNGYTIAFYWSFNREVILLIWGFTQVDGWFFSKRWNYYQNRRGNASSYVEQMIGFYRVHVTFSGQLGVCDIEYRTESSSQAFEMAETLLDKYKDAKDRYELWKDYWSPNNPEGYWQTEYYKDRG